MRENLQSVEVAYWIGVAQTDGYFKKRKYKRSKSINFSIVFTVSSKSLPMLRKFKILSEKIFKRKAKIHKIKKRKKYGYCIGVTRLLRIFQELDINFGDPPTPPRWTEKPELFGSYLAGVIDGDGDIRIKRPKYPQCVVRITCGSKPEKLAEFIRKILNCSVRITPKERESVLDGRKIRGRFFRLEFYVSSKNFKYVKKYVVPHMTIPHKIEKLRSFIRKRGWQRPGVPARRQYFPDHWGA